ncbi:MAG: hypothetical protein DBX39_00395 [Bacillota bacterium]|nr:MAG: hypothetical protein DBX39_00395 [Bacillota bacterium]
MEIGENNMKWKNGFYCDSEAPEGAVELTEEEYSALVCGQAEGLTIEEENGFPVLKDQRPSAEENEKKEKYLAAKRRLVSLSEDIVQYVAGEDVPSFAERKSDFIRLHNEVRIYEGKTERGIRTE